VGCGRGEWLELLAECGLDSYGVDLNGHAVAFCAERGLRVHCADVLEHLRVLPEGALGAITAFHLIEHLPLDSLRTFLEEARRTLVPSGLLMLESPNPESIKVGATDLSLRSDASASHSASARRHLRRTGRLRRHRGSAPQPLPRIVMGEGAIRDRGPAERADVRATGLCRDRPEAVMRFKPAAIHQFHGGSAQGDAITNGLLYTRDLLRELGFRSEIYCQDVAPELAGTIRSAPTFDDALRRPAACPFLLGDPLLRLADQPSMPEILIFHNITPQEFFDEDGEFARFADLSWAAARPPAPPRHGEPREFAVQRLPARAGGLRAPHGIASPPRSAGAGGRGTSDEPAEKAFRDDDSLRILFVGRIVANKRQDALLEVVRHLKRDGHPRPPRLFLAGGIGGGARLRRRTRIACPRSRRSRLRQLSRQGLRYRTQGPLSRMRRFPVAKQITRASACR
jgi:glycosyltransferase involved in cell wall biosynthesis